MPLRIRSGANATVLLLLLMLLNTCEIPDTVPPEVSISSPVNGSTVDEIVTIEVNASDNVRIDRVVLQVDNNTTAVKDDEHPYRLRWNTTSYADGGHTIVALAYDRAENEAASSSINLTVDNAAARPDTLAIHAVCYTNGHLEVSWEMSFASDFESYTLFKNSESVLSTADSIYFTASPEDTLYQDLDIRPLEQYYYWVKVTDEYGLSSTSPAAASTPDPAPDPVNILSVSYDRESMLVVWGASAAGDFASYTLLHAIGAEGPRDTVFVQRLVFPTFRQLTGYDPFDENWFWIVVTDTLGQSARGDSMTHAVEAIPVQPVFAEVDHSAGEFQLDWLNNYEPDFLSCRLYESYLHDMSGAREIFRTEVETDTSFSISGIAPGELRYYQLEVFDYWGLSNKSEIVYATSHDRFQTIMGGSGTDQALAGVETSDGAYVFAGFTDSYGAGIDDGWIVRLDESGDEEWSETIGGSGYDRIHDVVSGSDGSVVATGFTTENGSQAEDMLLVRLTSSGGTSWTRNFGGDGMDIANTLIAMENGDFALAGYSQSFGNGDVRIVRTDANGAELWDQRYDWSSWEEARAIAETDSGGFVLAGYQIENAVSGRDVLVAVLDPDGDTLRTFAWDEGLQDMAMGLERDDFGVFSIVGSSSSESEGLGQAWIAEFDPNNVSTTSASLVNSAGNERAYGFVVTDDGGYLVSGSSSSAGSVFGRLWYAKLSANLQVEWERMLEINSSGSAHSVVQTSDGGYLITGVTYVNGSADAIILKTDPLGKVSGFTR